MPPKIVQDNLRASLKAEQAKAKEVLDLYERFRIELFDAVAGEGSVTVSRIASKARKIERMIAGFRGDFLKILKSVLKKGTRMAMDHITSEIKEITKGISGENIRLNVKASVVLSNVEGLLVSQYESSVGRYGEELRGRISRVLAEGALRKQSFDQVSSRLAGEKGLLRQEAYKIERIVRTEFSEAYNHSRLQTLNESARILPGLKKKWDAFLDKRTSHICRELDEKVVELDKDFKTKDGMAFQKPPAHPNCRSAVVAWRDEWQGLI